MKCPMKLNQSGDLKYCDAENCAWWDTINHQCLVATYLKSNSNLFPYTIANTILGGEIHG